MLLQGRVQYGYVYKAPQDVIWCVPTFYEEVCEDSEGQNHSWQHIATWCALLSLRFNKHFRNAYNWNQEVFEHEDRGENKDCQG